MKPITLYRHIENGCLKWYKYQEVLYQAFLDKLKDGDTIEIKIKKQGPQKTNRQLSYWYGVLVPFAVNALHEAGNDTLFDVSVGDFKTGVATDNTTVDIFFKTLFKVHTSADKLPQKRNMTTKDMSDLIDFSLRWLAENLGVYCPTPDQK